MGIKENFDATDLIRRMRENLGLLFKIDAARHKLNPNAKQTTGMLLTLYEMHQPWNWYSPKDIGCKTVGEMCRLISRILGKGGHSVKQIT